MNIENTWRDEKLLHAPTGLMNAEDEDLLIDFSKELNLGKNGKNISDRRPKKLDNKGLFLMLILYYRHYPTFDLLAVVFELNSSNIKRWVDRSEKALKTVLAKKNLSHLIAPDQKQRSRKPLSNNEKSISMALSSL